MIQVHGRVYLSSYHYMKEEELRCRNGVCPEYALATSINRTADPPTPQCRSCRESMVMTGAWPTTKEK